MSLTKATYSMINGACANILDFGADPTGVADSTTAVQAAIDSVVSAGGVNGGQVYFPSGIYKITSTVTISTNGVHLIGDGTSATMINFMPSATSICFLWDKGSTVLFFGSIKQMTFYSNDTTYVKTAIKLVDVSGFVVRDVGTRSPHWTDASGSSVFLLLNGREHIWVQDIFASADRPLVINKIPSPHTASGIGLDQSNFHNVYFVGRSTNPIVEIGDNCPISQVSFTGTQSWVGGGYGLYWNDTTSVGISQGLVINNVRLEQGVDSTKQAFYISHNAGVQNFSVHSGYCGDRAGFYLRKCDSVSIIDYYASRAGVEVMNTDTTVRELSLISCFWQSTTTASMTGQLAIFSVPFEPNTGALPPTAFYSSTLNTSSNEIHDGVIAGTPFTVANAATTTIPFNFAAYFYVVTSNKYMALFANNSLAVYKVSDPISGFSTTAGNAGTTNIYISAGNLVLQNNTGGSLKYRINQFGSSVSF
jgi:hypothetical protein